MSIGGLPELSSGQCYRLFIEFDGSDFSGWQLQPNSRTVQGCIEKELAKLFDEAPRVIGAGRTDAGVHATGMVAHFRTDRERAPDVIKNSLNANLPPDIRIMQVEHAEPGFHARFDAKWRSYEYRIFSRQQAISRQYGWYLSEAIPVDSLQELAKEVLGNHCFRSFAHERPDEEDYRSIIYRSEWKKDESGLLYKIEGLRFLHGMVRLLVGTMLDIVRGSLQVDSLHDVIAKEDVRFAGTKAPAQGLTLTAVGYHEWPYP